MRTGWPSSPTRPTGIRCKHEYVYDYVTYGHLGGYRCPACGYCRPAADVAVTKVLSTDTECSRVLIRAGDTTYDTTVNLPGGYNIYNACAAMACGRALELNLDTVSAPFLPLPAVSGVWRSLKLRGQACA